MKSKKNLFVRIMLSVLGVAATAFIAVICFYMIWEKAPDIESAAPSTKPAELDKENEEPDSGMPFDTNRQDGVYTILLVGNDNGNGNTDTMVVGKIDTNLHKMDFISVPRDTLINVDWSVRKLNSVYWGSKNSGGSGIDALSSHIKKIIGFDVDCYAVIDLNVFIDVIDALGGVDFDVPVPMYYEDIGQNLYINLAPGMQHLDGYQAMGLCRFRAGYANGDYGRIEMQQKFLKACAEQFIKLGNIPNISKVVKILSDGMDTNLTGANIGFFLRQALKCAPEDINFHMVPSNGDYVGGLSYSVIDIWQWLPMLNEYLNPYDTPIEYSNLDIVYREGGGFTATTELRGAWYYAAKPAPKPEYEQEPVIPQETEGPTIIVVPNSPTPSPDTSPEPQEPDPETPGTIVPPEPDESTAPDVPDIPAAPEENTAPEQTQPGTEADNIFA